MQVAKTGEGVKELLDAIVERIPAPKIDEKDKTRALIFDSYFDDYRGVVLYVRIFDGEIPKTIYDNAILENDSKQWRLTENGELILLYEIPMYCDVITINDDPVNQLFNDASGLLQIRFF